MFELLLSQRTARWLLGTLATVLILASAAQADDKKPDPKADEAAIRAAAEAFVQAFNAGDAKAVAALWTEHGTLADDRGRILKGRKAIEEEYTAFFKAYPGTKMTVAVQSVEFPTPAMAVEDGTSQVTAKGAQPAAASRYTVVHVRDGDKWRMATVRESGVALPSNASRLEALDWFVGQWEANRDGATVRASFHWVANKSFLQRDYSVVHNGVVLASGVQIIGWDPREERIRSWSFDASGGYGSGLWSATKDGWAIDTVGMLPDGTPTSSRDQLIRVAGEDRVLGWRSTQRRVGETSLPDTREVVLDRVPQKP